MNIVVPGSGLILLGRLWLGTVLAGAFMLGVQGVVCGLLIAPAVVVPGITLAAGLLAVAVWLAAQRMLVLRYRFLSDPGLHRELTVLRRLARRAQARRDWRSARAALRLALSVDDTDIHTRLAWAEFMTRTAGRTRARRAWRAVARLDVDGHHASQIQAGLDSVPPPVRKATPTSANQPPQP